MGIEVVVIIKYPDIHIVRHGAPRCQFWSLNNLKCNGRIVLGFPDEPAPTY